jgi:hypothetical protein
MQHPPHWLTNQAVDMIKADKYNKLHEEFMDILETEEEKLHIKPRNFQSL